MENVLELVKEEPTKVTLKVNITDPLTAAEYSWLNANWAYITVTRGCNHIMTFINKDCSSWSITWGDSGCTMCSDSLNDTKWKIVNFIEKECGILLEYTGQPIEEATIYYNSNFKKWQLTLEGRTPRYWDAHVWDEKSNCLEDMIEFSKKYVDVANWKYKRAVTGIDTWKGVLA